ncbi:hypothetical protein [Rhodococcus gannanensis]|uniref:Uncharacterized protein n=1 Tax=Rhodococcus gannanensis TaxID=1960308 RepID=A0ABW4P9F1_9NOCA
MKLSVALRSAHHADAVPMLPTARTWRRRETWPAEGLERLLTPREVDDLVHGHFIR